MNVTRIHVHQKLIWFLATASLSVLIPLHNAQSQTINTANTARNRTVAPVTFNQPTPPANQGAPAGRVGGGASRGDCPSYAALTALVPVTDGAVWNLTTSAHPTLWFYLPGELPSGASVEFVLQDQADNYVYREAIPASVVQEGLAKFSVPESAPPLAMETSYTWTMAVYCNSEQPSESVFVNGTIHRVALDATVQVQLAQAEPMDQVRLYADSGIWHDALNQLARHYQANPTNADVRYLWSSLLQQANLDAIALTPFASCCTPADSSETTN